MASISLTIPDDQLDRVVDALCLAGHWSPALGVSRNAFAKQEVARLLRQRVLEVERRTIHESADAEADGLGEPDVS